MSFVLALFLLSSWSMSHSAAQHQNHNDINTPENVGQIVVLKVVKAVEDALGSTNNLLKDTAWVESKFGLDPNTFSNPKYHGGIWQVDNVGFRDTQDIKSHPRLKNVFKTIKDIFGIDWPNVKYSDLRIPLYAGIAARVKYRNVPASIPSDMRGKAQYWKKYYNTHLGKGTVGKFIADVRNMPDLTKGRRIFRTRGAQCHSCNKGDPHKTGPNLSGICGRKAGNSPGYNYTEAMKSSGITWTWQTLDSFLKDPTRFIPGTKMVFAGMRKAKERAHLIAYLCSM